MHLTLPCLYACGNHCSAYIRSERRFGYIPGRFTPSREHAVAVLQALQSGVVALGLIGSACGQPTQPPRRVVTMQPSFTEIVCALDACDRLVATDRYSNWPAEVTRLPKVGGHEDAQIEAIVGLHPDLVLLRRSERLAERLTQLKIRSVSVNP